MNAPAASLDLQWPAIAKTHNRWFELGLDIAKRCVRLKENVPVEKTVKTLVSERAKINNTHLCSFFGAPPQGVALPPSSDPNGGWLVQFWGQRCNHYVGTLSSGLNAARAFSSACAQARSVATAFAKLKEELNATYDKYWWNSAKIALTLKTRGDLTNSHITRLDPELFSALILFTKATFLSLLDAEATEHLRALIRKEVMRYLDTRGTPNSIVADDATLSWGILKLAQLDKGSFSLGSYAGWPGAIAAFKSLTDKATNRLTYPGEEKYFELTPEIYGEPRTRVLLARNCLSLLEAVPSEHRNNCASLLKEFIQTQIALILSDCTFERHASLLGLALEFSSTALHLKKILQTPCRPTLTQNSPRASEVVKRLQFLKNRSAIRFDGVEFVLSALEYVCLRVLARHSNTDMPQALLKRQKMLKTVFDNECKLVASFVQLPSNFTGDDENPIAKQLSRLRAMCREHNSKASKTLQQVLPNGQRQQYLLLAASEIDGLDWL